MADRSITVRLRADVSELKSGLGQAKKDIRSFSDTKPATNNIDGIGKAAKSAGTTVQKSMYAAKSAVNELSQAANGKPLTPLATDAEKSSGRIRTAMASAKKSLDELTKPDKINGREAFAKFADRAALAGAGLAAGLGLAVKKFADFDEAMSSVKANTETTAEGLSDLRQLAMDLGADTVFSATEAAQGINEMAKAGVSATDILSGGLKGALDLAASGQLDVAQAAEIAATAVNQYALTGKDVVHVADLYAAAAGKAQGSVQDVADAQKYAGVTAHAMGVSIEDATAVLGLFASQGIIGQQAGTSFRSMLLSLTSPSKIAAGAMQDLGINVYDASGKFIGMEGVAQTLQDKLGGLDEATRNQALGQIFGNEAMGAAIALYQAGGKGVDEWRKKVDDAGFASRQAADLTDNLKGDIEQLGGALDTVFIQTGSSANSSLRDLVQGLTFFVDVIGRIPGPVLMLSGVLGSLALLAPKGILKWREYAAQLDATGLSMGKLSAKAPRLASSLRAVGAASVVAGIASVARAIQDAQAAARVADVDIEKLAQTVGQLSGNGRLEGGVADLFRNNGGLLVAKEQFVSTSEAIERFAIVANDALSDNNYERVLRFLQGSPEPTLDKYIGQIDAALAQMVRDGNIEGAQAALDSLLSGIDNPQVVDDARSRFVLFAQAIKDTGDQSTTSAPQIGETSQAVQDIEQDAKDAEQALKDLKDQIEGFGSPLASQRAAERDYKDAIDDAKDALGKQRDELAKGYVEAHKRDKMSKKQLANLEIEGRKFADAQIKSGAALNQNTKAGRANQAALDAIRQAALDSAAATFELTSSSELAAEKVKRGRQDFIKFAVDGLGYSEKKAKDLADNMGLIPKDTETVIGLSGVETANTQLDNITGKVTTLDKKEAKPGVKPQVDNRAWSVAEQRLEQLARARNAEIRITVTESDTPQGTRVSVGGVSRGRYATGGVLPGWTPGRDVHRFYSPTGGRLDLSGGESIMIPQFTRAVGGPAGVARLNDLARRGEIATQRFAGGGVAGVRPERPNYLAMAKAAVGQGNSFTINGPDPAVVAQMVIDRLNWEAVNG